MQISKAILLLFLVQCSLEILAQESTEKKIVPVLSSDKYTEFSPTISADGKTIIFESNVDLDKGWELFESQLGNDGVWGTPVPLKSVNEKCQFLAGPSISYDGNQLFYTAFIEGISKTEDIFYSERTGDHSWSEPINIGAPINTDENYEGFPSISSDGRSLYFIRVNLENDFDRKNKEPCFIIYVSKKQSDGKWGEPVPLPSPINTGCERDPKIMADNHTLIFSSIRSGGLGKYDMYQTILQKDGTWSAPVALDFINSTDNDQSPCISASGDIMFYYSNDDIYSVPIPAKYKQRINAVISGHVLESASLKTVPAQIIVTNLKTGDSFSTSNNEADGEFSIVLSAGNKYSIVFENENFLPDTLRLDLENQKTYLLEQKNILLRATCETKIDVVDKDLGFRLDAWLQVQQENNEVFKDSVQASKLPLKLIFNAPLNYSIKAVKEMYTNHKSDWIFKEKRISHNRNVLVQLEHEKVEFTANVLSGTSKQKVKIKVYANNKGVQETIIADAGEKMLLRKGDRYQVVTASEEGYFFASQELIAGEVDSTDLFVVPIELDGRLRLNNITFETNSASLKKDSQFELDRVVELMKVNPKLSVEISAHTDDVGDEHLNLKLSDKRAKSAWDYLINKGVSKERLVPKGYGESKPLLPNDSDENRTQNRRVELRVLKIS
ncbi:MAG: OmpA family protein [Bacteroidetes bacterium]|nr:OmpA family protein [Bacteroidota bacterium]